MRISNSQSPMTNQVPMSKCPIFRFFNHLKISHWSLIGNWSLVIGHLVLFLVLCSLFFVLTSALTVEREALAYDINVVEPLTNPLGEQEVPTLLGTAIKAILSIVGSIALVIFIYGGFQWMTARGNTEQVASAQKIMLWAALGVFMIFGSYLILDLVFKAVK